MAEAFIGFAGGGGGDLWAQHERAVKQHTSPPESVTCGFGNPDHLNQELAVIGGCQSCGENYWGWLKYL